MVRSSSGGVKALDSESRLREVPVAAADRRRREAVQQHMIFYVTEIRSCRRQARNRFNSNCGTMKYCALACGWDTDSMGFILCGITISVYGLHTQISDVRRQSRSI